MLNLFEKFVATGLDACYYSGAPVVCSIAFLLLLSVGGLVAFLGGSYVLMKFVLQTRNDRRNRRAMNRAREHAQNRDLRR